MYAYVCVRALRKLSAVTCGKAKKLLQVPLGDMIFRIFLLNFLYFFTVNVAQISLLDDTLHSFTLNSLFLMCIHMHSHYQYDFAQPSAIQLIYAHFRHTSLVITQNLYGRREGTLAMREIPQSVQLSWKHAHNGVYFFILLQSCIHIYMYKTYHIFYCIFILFSPVSYFLFFFSFDIRLLSAFLSHVTRLQFIGRTLKMCHLRGC